MNNLYLKEYNNDLLNAVRILKSGGIILYPTDTVWGIGCDATNSEAVDFLFQLKKRPEAKAMLSLIDSIDTLHKWVTRIPEKALEEIVNTERPLTIIYDSPIGIAKALLSSDGSAAFRIPNCEFTRRLCKLLGKPLVSTSANFSGNKAPSTYSEIEEGLKDMVDYVCQYGRNLTAGIPSRIIRISNENIVSVIRE